MNATATNRKHALARTLLLGLAAGLSFGAQAGDAKQPHRVSTSVAVSYATSTSPKPPARARCMRA